MRLKTPEFWYKQNSLCSRTKALALLPFAGVYLLAHKLNQWARRSAAYTPKIPVLCVGNLVAGGSGKTPVALSLASLLQNQSDKKICFLSRGYGGTLKGPVLVDPAKHNYNDVGDEPLLLSQTAPTIISKNRKAGIVFAEKQGFDLVIMDDGLQNPSIKKTLSLLVIDGATGFGNGLPLPAGPLREPFKNGIARANAAVIIGTDKSGTLVKLGNALPVYKAQLAVKKKFSPDTDKAYFGFSGLGVPQKFRNTLENTLNLNLSGWISYPDHYAYKTEDLAALEEQAKITHARLITTAKDAMRFPPGYEWNKKPLIVPVHIDWDNQSALMDFLAEKLV